MIILRIAEGVRDHFPARKSEWALAIGLAGWGGLMLAPWPTFSSSPSYSHMAAMAAESTWGWGAVLVGGARILALIINGTFAHTRYGKVSPHVRGATAFLSCFVWLQIALGLLGSGAAPPGLAMYCAILGLDIFNTAQAFGDAGEADRTRRNDGS